MTETPDPRSTHHEGGFPRQVQDPPGQTGATRPEPDHGEQTWPSGHARLAGKRALVTGGDSGIGRAVAIAYAREGADVAISHLPAEQVDATDTVGLVEQAGRRALSLPGDIRDEQQCRAMVEQVVRSFGGLDVVVLNAAHQQDRESFESITTEQIATVFDTNLYGTLWTAQAALPHLGPGGSIIVTSSIQAFNPSPNLVDYAMTKAAQVALVKALAEELGERGVRVNAVAPGPIWTPLIPATGWPDSVPSFGQDSPLGRAGQPAELAGAYVYLASDEATYTSGAVLPVTGGKGL